MATKQYLDEAGLQTLWTKIKSYVASHSGGSNVSVTSMTGTAQTLTSGTTWTKIDSSEVTLPEAGIYMLVGANRFASNASGRRAIAWYNATNSTRITRSIVILPPVSGETTYMQTTYIAEVTGPTKFALQSYQNSGSSLSTTSYVQVVRLV